MHQKPYQSHLKAKSFTRKRSFCSRLASSSQPWRPQSVLKFVGRGAGCGEGFDLAVQSQTSFVAWFQVDVPQNLSVF